MLCDKGAGAPPGSLTVFTPRQVLLLNLRPRDPAASASMANERSEVNASSKLEEKSEYDSLVTYSVALWLENNGFTKILKRFLSAAQIQDDNWKDKGLDLNYVFSKYQESLKVASENIKIANKLGEQEVLSAQTNGDAAATIEKNGHVKKKRKNNKNTKDGTTTTEAIIQVEYTNRSKKGGDSHEDLKVSEKRETNGVADLIVGEKSEKLKKNKKKEKIVGGGAAISDIETVVDKGADEDTKELCDDVKRDQDSKESTERNADNVSELTGDKSTKKLKDKKSKHKSLSSHSSDPELLEKEPISARKCKDISDDAVETAFKKRKRKASDGKEILLGNDLAVEEVKSKKLKGSEEVSNGHPMEKNELDVSPSQVSSKTSVVNGVNESRDSKSDQKRIDRFKRVKVEEVKFADERLQDNSYWAKDGAESGYGAKAQEVLGQVKGRDFRHEKTKKKRGSYRGGQIDLQSHSIKFNYSDDE